MRAKRSCDQHDETRFYLERGFETGILHWQELAHLNFQDLIELIYRRSTFSEESEDII